MGERRLAFERGSRSYFAARYVDALERVIIGMARDAVYANTLIEKLRSTREGLERAQFAGSSEMLQARVARLDCAIEALELDEAERLAAAPNFVEPVEAARRGPALRPMPDQLPRETVAHAGPYGLPDLRSLPAPDR